MTRRRALQPGFREQLRNPQSKDLRQTGQRREPRIRRALRFLATRRPPGFDELDLVLGHPGAECQRLLRETSFLAQAPQRGAQLLRSGLTPRHSAMVLTSIHRLTLCVCSCLWIPSGIDVTRVCGRA